MVGSTAVGTNGTLSRKDPIWVRPDTNVQLLGNKVSEWITDQSGEKVVLRAIGAGAINQAIKGAIVASMKLANGGYDMVIRPGFETVPGNEGDEVSAVVLRCHLT